ncbi:hypothetical protein DH2020_020255 [Rehmannia glutinosa]|uniref:Uncharacterized protein n=1 Tax=Rehmannia glutinosa TaxID=99300 RepID=A0ABR0WIH6_REHGL
MTTLSPVPSMQDLKVTYQDYSLVFPSLESQRKSIFLSNIDQIFNFNLSIANFFKPKPDFPPEIVAKRLKMALEKILVSYDFIAGRLKLNDKLGRLEIDCNAAGAGFVVASSELSLDEVGGYINYPNLGYRQLVVERLDNLAPEVDQPLCVFQVTSFKCGGFAIGMSANHILFDGLGARTCLENIASQAFDGKPFAVTPCHNRRILAARSPPQVVFPHPELIDLNQLVSRGSSPSVFDCVQEELELRIFKFSSTDIAQLKEKAKLDTIKMSTFAVVAALMWRCKALSADNEKDRVLSTLLNFIDIRPRLNPPLPPSYSGNAVLLAGVSATYQELENGPFSKLVKIISDGGKEITDEYVKSTLDWLEVHRGIPYGDYIVSSWLRIGYDEVIYPWGKPIYTCPVVNHRKDICWIFPVDGGVGALVALPAQEMERFEALFHKFVASSGKLHLTSCL